MEDGGDSDDADSGNALHPAHAPPTPTPVKRSGRKQKNDVATGEANPFRVPSSSRTSRKQTTEEESPVARSSRRMIVKSDSDDDVDDDFGDMFSVNSGNSVSLFDHRRTE